MRGPRCCIRGLASRRRGHPPPLIPHLTTPSTARGFKTPAAAAGLKAAPPAQPATPRWPPRRAARQKGGEERTQQQRGGQQRSAGRAEAGPSWAGQGGAGPGGVNRAQPATMGRAGQGRRGATRGGEEGEGDAVCLAPIALRRRAVRPGPGHGLADSLPRPRPTRPGRPRPPAPRAGLGPYQTWRRGGELSSVQPGRSRIWPVARRQRGGVRRGGPRDRGVRQGPRPRRDAGPPRWADGMTGPACTARPRETLVVPRPLTSSSAVSY